MTKLFRVCSAIALTACIISVTAQNLKTYKERIGSPIRIDSLRTINATVESRESGRAAIVGNIEEQKAAAVDGFRIMIFMSKTPTARTEALAARDSIAKYVPSHRQYVTYENPYFKVSVGNCTTQEEALVLLEDVKRYFPKAFIMRENIPLEELIIE
ncbi:MAG: hypothetical protein IKC42_02115 [Alistipes sp.]|nr:hypothetical protein [Alistipes sp.]